VGILPTAAIRQHIYTLCASAQQLKNYFTTERTANTEEMTSAK